MANVDPRSSANEFRDVVSEEKITGVQLANEGIKVSKNVAGFREGGGAGERSCGVCQFYEQGVCEVVEGVVTPDDISNLFEPIMNRGNISAMESGEPQSVKKAMYITRVSYDKQSGKRRWFATASGIKRDQYEERMSVPLFQDFIARIEDREVPPPPYSSEYFQGGLPYLSVAHYLDLNGEGSVGRSERVWYDGNVLKAKGVFNDSPMALRAYEAIERDLQNNVPEDERVRISIAFLDHGHEHEGHGQFTRRTLDEKCPMCAEGVKEKIYTKGQLIHLALTRIPAYKETSIQVVERNMTLEQKNLKKLDASSIVGEEFAENLEEKTRQLMVNRSGQEAGEALVIKMDDEEGEEMEDEEMTDEEKKKKEDEKRLLEAQKSLANYGGATSLEEAETFLSANPEMVTTPLDVLTTILVNAVDANQEQAAVVRSVLSDYQNSLNVQSAEALQKVQQFLEGGLPMTEKNNEPTVEAGVDEGVLAAEEAEGLVAPLKSLQAKIDEIKATGADPQQQLAAIQEPFEQFVAESADVLRSEFQPDKKGDGNGGLTMADVQRAVQEAVAPLLAVIQDKKAIEAQTVTPPAPSATVKRALQPIANVVEQNAVTVTPVNRSGEAVKPGSLKDIVRRSVGIRQ